MERELDKERQKERERERQRERERLLPVRCIVHSLCVCALVSLRACMVERGHDRRRVSVCVCVCVCVYESVYTSDLVCLCDVKGRPNSVVICGTLTFVPVKSPTFVLPQFMTLPSLLLACISSEVYNLLHTVCVCVVQRDGWIGRGCSVSMSAVMCGRIKRYH